MREFKTNNDIYSFARELVDLAKDHDDIETMSLIQDVFRENFTPSEILGELRSVLEKIRMETRKGYLSPALGDIERAIQVINLAFTKANRPR